MHTNKRTEKPYKMPSSDVEIIAALSSGMPVDTMVEILSEGCMLQEPYYMQKRYISF